MARNPRTGRRNFLRFFGIGAAGAAATVASSVLPAKAEVVEKIVEVPIAGGLVWAREEFGYGPLQLEAGEVFALTGLRNDHLLTGQGYARMIGPLGIVLCNCGRRFVFDEQGDQATANYILDHCTRTGHRPADLARPLPDRPDAWSREDIVGTIRPTITVVDETRVGSLAHRREVMLEVNALELDEEQACIIANRVVNAMKWHDVFPDAKIEQRLRAAAAQPVISFDLGSEPDPEILEVGGTLRPSLIRDPRVADDIAANRLGYLEVDDEAVDDEARFAAQLQTLRERNGTRRSP